jgi:hypothetical protein
VTRVAVGDHVMVQQEPVKAKNGKLGPRWTGPWCLEQQADSNGVTYVCRLEGRHVTRRTIHVTRMKKFKQRPVHLEPDDSSNQSSSPNDNIQQLIEAKALKVYSISDLNTFHALYELKHHDQMPRYASRKRQAGCVPILTKEAAMKQFPIGTPVLREEEDGTYVKGEIAGYYRPYWRARYEDELWADLNKTEVLVALQLLSIVGEPRVAKRLEKTDEFLLNGDGTVLDEYPDGFRQNCKEQITNLKWTTG